MSNLPIAFINRINNQLKDESDDFFKALSENPPTSIRINLSKTDKIPFDESDSIPWCNSGYYLNDRPSFTFDPLFHAGHYYVQEASSMFLEQIFKQHVSNEKQLKILDLCAAPGGKSTHLLSLINNNSLLISNEVIQSRSSILSENLTRWGNSNVVVTNNDPEHFNDFENCFDIVVIDAPCSGEGMFRKDLNAREEWSEGNVKLCSSRQQRILNTASTLVKPGGMIIYSTCTFSLEEDENQIEQLLSTGNWESLKINTSAFPEIVETKIGQSFGYRFYPHKTKGEGFFISALQKSMNEEIGNWPKPSKKTIYADKKSIAVAKKYLIDSSYEFIIHNNQVLFFPFQIKNEMLGLLNTRLHLRKFGTELGQIIREELIPSHALAMSIEQTKSIPSIELNLDQAIAYLQKNDFPLSNSEKGWYLMKYKGAVLGWAKLLGNRLNNAYPKEARIRKQKDE